MFFWIVYLICTNAIAASPPSLDKLATKLLHSDLSSVKVSDEPEFQFFKGEKDTWLIGLRQSFRVHTSMQKFTAFLANPKNYKGLFNGVLDAKLVNRKSKFKYSIYTETSLPIPFMKPDRTTMHYELKQSRGKALYKISLEDSKSLTSYTGFLLLAPLKGGYCYVYRFDFFEPNLGIVKILGQEKIWSESAVTALQADRAIKLFLEHPDWDGKKINQKSNEDLDISRANYRELYASREEFLLENALPQMLPKKVKSKKK